jgi:hypothetical protein
MSRVVVDELEESRKFLLLSSSSFSRACNFAKMVREKAEKL